MIRKQTAIHVTKGFVHVFNPQRPRQAFRCITAHFVFLTSIFWEERRSGDLLGDGIFILIPFSFRASPGSSFDLRHAGIVAGPNRVMLLCQRSRLDGLSGPCSNITRSEDSTLRISYFSCLGLKDSRKMPRLHAEQARSISRQTNLLKHFTTELVGNLLNYFVRYSLS